MLSKSILAAAMLGVSAVDAHMIMTKPVPYSVSTLNNSPLAADGSDFPCKLRSNTYDVTEMNTAKIGESMPLTFEGSATHGGGSCQISLTTDSEPTKDSEWMVVKSFEGGCPANVEGNLSGGATTADPYTFNYTIPTGISPGRYTLAWTWFNRVGNREMYMNCAPLTVESASSSKRDAGSETETVEVEVEKRSSSFPPMFVANINGCTTTEGVDIRFPQPGSDVEFDGEPSNLAAAGAAACTGTPTFAAAGDSSSGSYSGSGSSSGSSAASAAVTTAASTYIKPKPVQTGGSATSIQIAPAAANTGSSSSSGSSSSGSGSGSGSSAAIPSTSSTTSGSLTGACSEEGEWNCIGGTSFQRCASGQWSAVQAMAAGTQCTAGQSATLSMSATKRSTSRMLKEKRRRHPHSGGRNHA
ncbi:hypothetical protein BO70DRAFT_53371 [Aspergillus heteromorphus CBS 117.55]|uniref:Lytic polysaccharide monooxygenase n=1 Tax=Aspergillus heteromorphus CBS 117.55 TaxID=1448321 RepID=A0A317VZK6_9EURO|nr:uncharacterized protein BO70DRAFT_53371 [Aspergillus heteromorphus CBS 117.55]PWY79683.1 hypothetical protein BO70DRAFT_53371 [Aspergillus heteromorphus CBS 117.55]